MRPQVPCRHSHRNPSPVPGVFFFSNNIWRKPVEKQTKLVWARFRGFLVDVVRKYIYIYIKPSHSVEKLESNPPKLFQVRNPPGNQTTHRRRSSGPAKVVPWRPGKSPAELAPSPGGTRWRMWHPPWRTGERTKRIAPPAAESP